MIIVDKLRKEGIECITNSDIIKEKSMDLSYMSNYLNCKPTQPICVAIPKNENDVIKIVELALEEHIPIVPRGAGKNNICGAVPLKGGIILDTSYLNTIRDEGDEILLGAGVKIINVYDKLRVYPSTFKDGVTIGGNYEGGCGGIGAFRFGRVWYQATEVKMVNPKGKLVSLKGSDVLIAAHAEGTTGIVTSLKMLTFNEKIKSKILLFDSLEKAIDTVANFYDEALPIYHVTLRSPEASSLTGVLPFSKWSLLIAYPDYLDFDGIDGDKLWDKRDTFYGGLIRTFYDKKGKERTYYLTFDVELDELYKFLDKISFRNYVTELEFIQGKLIHPFFISDEEKKIKELDKLVSNYYVKKFDLHSVIINNRLRPDHLQRIKTYKKMYDKEDLFNPGKILIV
ncbi:FAD-binding protein [Acidianus sulfidivorans JP7]|uniref:FAD-binding PCMH-type domain-containing protein n=1 Tax=Acidianus sulfidivorans JP7 TaxID=619593 RepID=A0A2U9ILE7_9CREN|nr:FAD-binding oxidoreductase [Acidianus sulfidivorans]AWR96837.1 FAD-binding protein [Acidianus sulfidivorans JP7]